MTEKHLTNQKFTELNLEESLLQGLADAGFEYCTPIQADALPPALDGKDVAGQAQTGTGKTAAFLLATFNHLLLNLPSPDQASDQPRALILAPTRELAIQIHKDARVLGGHTGLKLGLVYGGTGYESQRNMIREGVDVLIGTPGRLIDYLKQGVYNLNHIQVTVMDEADRMFDLGFIDDVRYMLRRMPPAQDRLNMLFSATLSFRVNELAYEHMNDPQVIKIDAEKLVVDQVEERAYYPATDEKIPLLVNLLKTTDCERTLVFVNTKRAAEQVSRWLQANDISAAVLSGDVPQRMRERLLKEFTDGARDVLVATDVAARGLHIPNVSHVINFDLPQDAEDYVHRIGRTARAGASGEAISFICERYAYSMMDIEGYIGHSLPIADITPELLVKVAYPARQAPESPRRGRGRPESRGRGRRGERGPRRRTGKAEPR
ncbi:MAG: ATP-dependent RNA helicase RhlB, partial [Pseudomonadota bacterium]|nr:ATP-dependent RNA helicase RhlB [Pseudomonadota bacterium]